MKKISDSKNIKMGVVLSYVGMAVSIIGALFVSNKVLNYIGDYNYGLYSFVNSITTWLTVASSALTASFLRYTTIEANENDGDVGKTNTLYFKMLTIIGLVVFAIGFTVLGVLFFSKINIGKYNWEDSQLMYLLFVLSIFNIGLTMPTNIYSLYISYRKQFVFGKNLSIFTSILNFAGQIIIAYFTRNIVFIAGFSIIITLMTLVCNSLYCYKDLHINFSKATFKDNATLVRSIFIFSGILLFNSIVDQINSNVDKTLLGIFSTPENVTIYQMGQQLAGYLTLMSVSVSGVFAPTINELVTNNDKCKINELYLKISKIQSIILCCVAFGFLACGKNFIIWWLGEDRILSYYVATALMILSLGPLTLNSSIEIQRAENKHRFRAAVYFVLAIANVGLSIFFLNVLDTQKAVFACLAGTVITTICSHWIAMNIYNKRIIGLPIKKYLYTLLQYMLIGVVGYLVVLICNKLFIDHVEYVFLKLVIQGIIFVVVYFTISLLLNKDAVIKYLRKYRRKKCKC